MKNLNEDKNPNLNNSKNNIDIPEMSLKKNLFGRWTEFFVNRHRVTILLIVIILFWGISKAAMLQREAEPKVTIPIIIVSASYIGASPQEVETLITNPLEKKLKEVEDVDKTTSTSGFGYSSIVLEFKTGVDIKEKLTEVRETVTEAEDLLPDSIDSPIVSDMKTGDNPVVVFTLSGHDDLMVLQDFAEKIKEKVILVDGVNDIDIVGDVDREIIVSVDPQKLTTYGISLQNIKNALEASNINFPGGNVELNSKNYNIRTVGQFEDVEEIGNTIISYSQNGAIYIKDIAVVKDQYAAPDILIRRVSSDGNDLMNEAKAVVVSVKKTQTSDDIKVRDDILKLLKDEKGSLYPEHIKIDVYSDKAEDVENQLGSLIYSAISGLCLVIVVLYLFIGLGESLVVSVAIPLSILTGLGLMQTYNMSLNMVSMFALLLAVGMLVDNAIVVMENIDRLRHEGLSSTEAAKVATNQIAPAVFSATLTTLAAFFPLSLTTGIMGDYIKSIPFTVIFTIAASFFIAITITPTICSMFLKGHKKNAKIKTHPVREKVMKVVSVVFVFILIVLSFVDWEKEGVSKITILSIIMGLLFATGMFLKQFRNNKSGDQVIINKYSKVLSWIVDKPSRRFIALGSVFLLFLLTLGLIPSGILKVEMFGADDFPTLYVSISTPPGSTLDNTLKVQKLVEERLNKVDEIKSIISFTGHSGVDMYSYGDDGDTKGVPNLGRIIIGLKDLNERDRSSMEIADGIREITKDIVGADIGVEELSAGPPSGGAVYIRVKGDDLEEVEKVTKDLTNILETVEGTSKVENSVGMMNPEIQIKIDKSRAASMGLDSLSIAFSMRNALNDLEATKYRINQDEIDVIIRTDEGKLETINDIDNISFYSNSGISVPFSQIAQKHEGESTRMIQHEDGKRYMSISSDVNQGVTSSEVINKFEEKIKEYQFPDGVIKDYGGESEMMGDSFGDMIFNMIFAIILVFIILAVQFNSLSQPFIILITVPMSLIGVILGLLITGNNFGFLSFVGVVALVGIVVNDAIVLIDYINYLRKIGYNMKEAVVKTGETRFVPVFATTITTAGGILPITLADPFFAPLGITLIAGLCVATVLTLIIVPTVYLISEGFKSKFKKDNSIESEGVSAV